MNPSKGKTDEQRPDPEERDPQCSVYARHVDSGVGASGLNHVAAGWLGRAVRFRAVPGGADARTDAASEAALAYVGPCG
jgi:hypothetical protein